MAVPGPQKRLFLTANPVTFLPPEPTVEALRVALAGAVSGDGYQHVQTVPASTWSITLPNSLGRRPMVTVYSDSGEVVEADVTASPTHVSVSFPEPTAGSVTIS